MKTHPILTGVTLAIGLVVGSVSLAHQGVEDPSVKARMHAMGQAAAATKTLGGLAKGQIAFDRAKAESAKSALIEVSDQIPALFRDFADDPLTEAKVEIWSNFEDFTSKSEAMLAAATALDTSSVETLQAGMRAIGASCGGCHKAYRVKQ